MKTFPAPLPEPYRSHICAAIALCRAHAPDYLARVWMLVRDRVASDPRGLPSFPDHAHYFFSLP